jgi:hypothetical protein
MHEHLDIPYHQQDTDYYCGAACAQMVLHAIGQPLLPQADLYNDNHNHTSEASAWSSPPDGLCWTMNNRQATKHFTLDSTDTEDPISRTICWSIHRYQCAPIALVFGGNHWAVVRGYSASAAPATSFDTSYTIASFDLNNPWPPVPAPPGPPPHSDGDVCGGGGNRGIADINVSYTTWQTDYLTANVFGTQWLGKFVAVCDPDPPGEPPPPPGPERRTRADGQRVIDAGIVREELVSNLKAAGLLSHPVWSKVFDHVRTGEPLLVQRLDRPGSDYWLVPTVDERGKPRAAVGIDARFGDYQQAIAVRNPDASLFAFADVQKAMDQVRGRQFELPGNAGRLAVRAKELSANPPLVWQPCRESLSPFYPFRMILQGAHRLFVRVYDGAVFTALTNDQGGL